jgi:hypothetical protein
MGMGVIGDEMSETRIYVRIRDGMSQFRQVVPG